jgi:hypothetical protein
MLYRYLERNVVLHFDAAMKSHRKYWQLVVNSTQETLDITLTDDDDPEDDRAPVAETPRYVNCSKQLLLSVYFKKHLYVRTARKVQW